MQSAARTCCEKRTEMYDRQAIVNQTHAYLYKEPDRRSEMTDDVLFGMTVEILEETGDYVRVRAPWRYEGYAERTVLTEHPVWSGELRVVTRALADVMDRPRVQEAVLVSIPRGGLVRLSDEEAFCADDGNGSDQKSIMADLPGGPYTAGDLEGWTAVVLPDGRTGWMRSSALGIPHTEMDCPEEEFRRRVVETAKLYLGTQYRWGGHTPLGIDCSGLTSISYYLNGVVIYRDARIVDGFPVHEIPFKSRRSGDLLFFKGHIAMVLDEDRYIHSTGRAGSDGVVINSLNPAHKDYREDLAKGILAVGSIF